MAAETEDEIGSNTPDPEIVIGHIERLEGFDEEIRKIKAENAARVKAVQKKKKDQYKDAKVDGVTKATLDYVLAERAHARKQAERIEDLGRDEIDDLEMTIEALGAFGDTALGQSAIKKVRNSLDEEDSDMDEFDAAADLAEEQTAAE